VSHFDFTRPSGVWGGEFVPGAADYRDFDYKQSKGIDGDDGGGTYTPSSPIIIGGAGMNMSAASAFATGGVATATGGRVYTGGATDFPVLNDRTRTITFPALRAGVGVGPNVNFPSQLEESWITPVFGPFGAGISFNPLNQPTFFMVNIPKRCCHNAAVIVTASIQFAITARPSALPVSQYPRFTLIGHDYFGNLTSSWPTPNNLVAFSSPAVWAALTAYSVGSYVGPVSTNSQKGLYFKATAISGTGTSQSTEPVWPTIVGGTVIDNPGANQITWTAVGRSGIYPIGKASLDTYYNNGQVQSVYFDPDPGAAYPANSINNDANRYAFYFPEQAIDPAMVLTSFTLSYGRIRLMGQE
jgi:hypothetical protein